MGPFTDRTYGSQVRQVGSWHDDEAWFVWTGYPWFRRSELASDGVGAGVFSYNPSNGEAYGHVSFRVVLSV